MHPAAYAAFLIASVVAQLASPPVAFRWRAHDAVAEAVAISPEGVKTGFWCEGLHGSQARCFAQMGDDAPVAIFGGGAIDAADAGLRPPFADVRHFSMSGGRIDWNGSRPVFSVACHTGKFTGICRQVLGEAPVVAGSALQPLESRIVRAGSTILWSDAELSRVTFHAGARTIDVCCADTSAAYDAAALSGGDMILVYAGNGRPPDVRAAVIAPDLSVRRDTVLAHALAVPESIAVVSAGGTTFVVWSGGGVFAALGNDVVKLSNAGTAPAMATDGRRVVAAWLERGAVMTAELTRADLPRSLLALRAATVQPFLTLDCSNGRLVAHWRARSMPDEGIVIATRDIW